MTPRSPLRKNRDKVEAALREEVARLRAEERRQTFWVKLAAGLLAAILVAQLVSL